MESKIWEFSHKHQRIRVGTSAVTGILSPVSGEQEGVVPVQVMGRANGDLTPGFRIFENSRQNQYRVQ